MKTKIQHFLKVDERKFKKIIWKLQKSKKISNGYKIMYKTDFITVEISIYNKQFKDEILSSHYRKTNLPYYAIFMLYFIKFLYYDLNILPLNNYRILKRYILSWWIGIKDEQYIVL